MKREEKIGDALVGIIRGIGRQEDEKEWKREGNCDGEGRNMRRGIIGNNRKNNRKNRDEEEGI